VRWARIVLAFAGFTLLGIGAGTSGVLLPSQLADYQVDRVTFGATFFVFSAGYVLTSFGNGLLLRWMGTRWHLTAGAALFAAVSLAVGTRPAFALYITASFALGAANGMLDAGLNSFISSLPGATALLNYLHAFFGVGALIGPVLASQMLHAGLPWQDIPLVLAAAAVPVLVGAVVLLPRRAAAIRAVGAAEPGPGLEPEPADREHAAALSQTVRRLAIWLAALFLCLYVGIEVSVGNWGFSFLTEERGQGSLFAGYVVSGYWLGLTLGRFLLNALAARAGVSVTRMMYACLTGLLAATLLAWFGPGALLSTVGFGLMGFFLGPVFPTTVAVLPRLAPARLVNSAIGLLVGMSVVGGAVFPYAAGALAQGLGLGSLLPYVLVLSVVQVGGWWLIVRRMSQPEAGLPEAGPAGSTPLPRSAAQDLASSVMTDAAEAGSAP
jgi:fucose permease